MSAKPRILCVDDEPELLAALALNLRRRFDVVTADCAARALELIAELTFAAVMTDLRMPGMDGAELLATCRVRAPQTVRVMLTGSADDAALAVLGTDTIFRLLRKPCMADVLVAALAAACAEHDRLIAHAEAAS
jgi:DNA-binding NtrC family response regulator